jgi:hypothetical protein
LLPLHWETADGPGLVMHRAIRDPFVVVGRQGDLWALGYGTPPDVLMLGTFPTSDDAKAYVEMLRPILAMAEAKGVASSRLLLAALRAKAGEE